MFVRGRTEPRVIWLQEVIAIIILVFIAFFIFYPKDRIKLYVAREQSNYDLTLSYLQNIANADPNNHKNWERIIELLIKMQKFNEAQKIFDNHLKDDKERRFLKYKIKKAKYFAKKDTYKADEYLQDLKDELREILKVRDVMLWKKALSEAYMLNDSELIFDALNRFYSIKRVITENELENIYNLAIGAGKVKEYTTLMQKLFDKKGSESIGKRLAKTYLDLQKFDKSSNIYQKLYEKQGTKELFLTTLKYLSFASNKSKAVDFLKRYEDRYIQDRDISIKIMKFYISNGFLDEAKEFSLKQMRVRGII